MTRGPDRSNSSGRTSQVGVGKLDAWTEFWFAPASPRRANQIRRVAAVGFLFYLLSMLPDLLAFCGPHGMLPTETVKRVTTNFGQNTSLRVSWLLLSESPILLIGTWLLAVLSATGLVLHWRTRFTAPLCFLLALTFVHRLPMVTGPFEWVLTSLLLYVCFAHSVEERSWSSGLVGRLCQVHLTALYITIGLSQLSAPTWWEGDATWWLIANTEARVIDLSFLGSATPGLYLVNALTHSLVAITLAFPILIWTTKHQRLLLKIIAAYWITVFLITGWTGYCGLVLAATWVCFDDGRSQEPGVDSAETKR